MHLLSSLSSLATSATWEDVALAFIAALPGAIAAVSSIKNGRRLGSGFDANQVSLDSVNRVIRQPGNSHRQASADERKPRPAR
jgi:hypothetical protein